MKALAIKAVDRQLVTIPLQLQGIYLYPYVEIITEVILLEASHTCPTR
jgi:hypothetical protein